MIFRAFIIATFSLFTIHQLQAEGKGDSAVTTTYKATGKAKVFSTGNGESFTIVPLDPQSSNRFVIYFEGVGGPWDSKSILHKKIDKSNGGEEFVTEDSRRPWTTFNSSSTWWSGYKMISGEAKGTGKSLSLYYDDDASKKLDAAAVEKILSHVESK